MNLRVCWIRFRVHDINSRGPDTGDNEVAPLKESVPCERRQRRRASVPAEVVKLVPLVGHRHRVDDLTEGRRAGLYVDHCERVGLREVWAEQQSIDKSL